MAAIPDMVGIAQLVRALDCGSRGRGFETLYPPQLISSLSERLITQALPPRRFVPNKARVPYVGMSPSGKAPDFDSGIRRFDPCHPSS